MLFQGKLFNANSSMCWSVKKVQEKLQMNKNFKTLKYKQGIAMHFKGRTAKTSGSSAD